MDVQNYISGRKGKIYKKILKNRIILFPNFERQRRKEVTFYLWKRLQTDQAVRISFATRRPPLDKKMTKKCWRDPRNTFMRGLDLTQDLPPSASPMRCRGEADTPAAAAHCHVARDGPRAPYFSFSLQPRLQHNWPVHSLPFFLNYAYDTIRGTFAFPKYPRNFFATSLTLSLSIKHAS